MSPSERFRKVFVWIGIAVVAFAAVLLQRVRSDSDAALTSDEGGFVEDRPDAGEGEPARSTIEPVALESQLAAKMTVALHALAPSVGSDQILRQVENARNGAFADRLGYCVLVGNFEGWDRGVAQAKEIALPTDAVDEARALRDRVIDAMRALAEERAPTAEEAESLEALRPTLGYFVDVLGPGAVAKATATTAVLVAAGLWYLVAFLLGLVALVVLIGLTGTGKVRPVFAPAPSAHAAVVLGETFLLWIVSFLGLNVIAAAVALPFAEQLGAGGSLLVSVLVMFTSLAALAYPAKRGVHWSELRALIGLHTGAGVVREALHGVLCYLSAVPLLVFGLVCFAILSAIAEMFQGDAPPPSHPVVEMFAGAGGFEVLMLFMLASVTAPIVEEIAFRGLLYGHLRGVVAPRVRLISMLIAAFASSAVFAVIHPQGVLFVPALGGLAVGFCLYREMRGSLVAPMVAHGLNNAVTLTIGLALMS
jgi:membrane protease YdiL (CAAX protease family)